jgi:hypothetical protein
MPLNPDKYNHNKPSLTDFMQYDYLPLSVLWQLTLPSKQPQITIYHNQGWNRDKWECMKKLHRRAQYVKYLMNR